MNNIIIALLNILTARNKYQVTVYGSNCLVDFDSKKQKVGFGKILTIYQRNEDEAKKMAIKLVEKELELLLLNTENDPLHIKVEDIQLKNIFEKSATSGFAWYPEKESDI